MPQSDITRSRRWTGLKYTPTTARPVTAEDKMRFAERRGYTQARTALQIDTIEAPLRNRLWNVVSQYWLREGDWYRSPRGFARSRADRLWSDYFKLAEDTVPDIYQDYYQRVRDFYFDEAPWYGVYDFLEYVLDDIDAYLGGVDQPCAAITKILGEEGAGYRLASRRFVPITSDAEVAQVEQATAGSAQDPITAHLQTAVGLLSDRIAPDYWNSIKESVSAIEAIARQFAGEDKATLAKALTAIEKGGVLHIHGSLAEALNKLYGYASDQGGIRHSMVEGEAPPERDDAVFMLVVCSATVNYLRSTAARSGFSL